MKDKVYKWLFRSIVGVGIASTLAHVVYIIYAYQNSSITYFITKEWW